MRSPVFLNEMNTEKKTYQYLLLLAITILTIPPARSKRTKRRVTPKIYESLYGARNFHFVYNNCLFIICGIDRNSAEYLNDLRDTLSQKAVREEVYFCFYSFSSKGLG